MLETVIVILAVLAALLFMVWRLRRNLRGEGECCGCAGTCAGNCKHCSCLPDANEESAQNNKETK